METNEILKAQILDNIENQLKNNDPPETSITLKRLMGEGYSEFESKQLIGQCVTVEIFGVFKDGTPFNNQRYIDNLLKLPEQPFN